MKTLVTGGAGFTGSNIGGFLLERSHKVTILDNQLSGYRANLATVPEVNLIEGDLRDPDVLSRVVDGVDVIFHCE